MQLHCKFYALYSSLFIFIENTPPPSYALCYGSSPAGFGLRMLIYRLLKGDEPKAVSEQSEIASSFAAVCVFHYFIWSVPFTETLPPENAGCD